MRYPRLVVALVASVALALSGCSSSGSSSNGKGFNNADVDFATDMVQHHAQALQMVDLTLGRDLDPDVARLTEQIRAAQTPEIERMVDWLEDWDQRVPPTSRDHANAHADGHGQGANMGSDMPGMMSPQQLTALEKASGGEFQTMWLKMMIEHHEGAIEMAEKEIEEGQNAKATALAEDIVTAQEKEVARMKEMLRG